MNTPTEDKDTAKAQALRQVAAIVEMVAALEVDYERLEELREFLNAEGLMNTDAMEELRELENAAGECKSREEAERRIDESPLSVEVRSSWHGPHGDGVPAEFRIVLCTGGPHVEIVGELGAYSEPTRARVIYSDWDTLDELFDFDRETVLTYCRQFYFGD